MLFKSLTLHGFKTFSDKTTLFFDDGITAIVGPNGSGKSNISDAIRWVLGEQSSKVLRCSKMEDVIFNGTPLKKAQGFAEVSITIENKDRGLDFNTDEVVITRRYYRSGDSEYLINGTNVRLKDLHELFMDTGLGKDGYSVIGQGKIDSIVASKSEDRREIFEEAAGISKYRYRKADAERKLEQAKENLLRLSDIVQELEERVGPLREQSEKAQKYLDFSEEKKKLEIGLWVSTLENFADIIKNHDEKLLNSRSQHDEIEEELSKINTEVESNFLKSNNCISKVDEVRREISNFGELVSQKNNKISVFENDIYHNEETIKRFQIEVKSSLKSSEILDEEIKEKLSQIDDSKKSLSLKQDELKLNTNVFLELQEEMSKASDEVSSMTKELSDLNMQFSDKKIKIMTSDSAIKEIESRISRLDLELSSILEKILDVEQVSNDYKSMDIESQEKVQVLENSISGYELKLNSKRKKVSELKSRSDSLRLDTEDKLRRIKLLEDLEKNLEGFSYSVKTVMKEYKHGMLTGIHGPISNLIKVDDKYSLAISTVLGASIQNIVVDNEADAKKAILLLKRKNCGRATFLPLTTIKGNEISENDLKKFNGFVGIANKLCIVDPKYNEILKFILGRVVVVDDIDSAIAISKAFNYKFRVVTLDGQVVNAGGSFTGGSTVKNSNILSRKSEIKKLQDEYTNLKKESEQASEEFEKFSEELNNIEAKVLGSKGDLTRAREEKFKISTEYKRSTLELQSLKKSKESYEKEMENSDIKVKDLIKEKDIQNQESEVLSRKMSKLEIEIKSKSGNKNESLEKREEINEKIQKNKMDIFSLEKEIESFHIQIKNIEYRKNTSIEKSKEVNNEIEILSQKNKDIHNQILILKEESEKLKEESKKSDQKIIDLNEERMQLEKRSTDLRKLEREKTNDREIIARDLSKLEEKKNNLQKEYDDIIAKLWDEYELTRSEACQNCEKIEDKNKANRELNELKNKIKSLGNVNVAAVEEYKEVSKRYNFMKEQVDDVEKSRDSLCKLINDLTKQMKNMFATKFNEINKHFKIAFKDLFGGGDANISLTNPDEILSSGIEIEVCPPGKIVNRLEALSGGERALVAISLYFGIMNVNPPPFCVLDEIEAALDEVNVTRFASYLRKMNDNTQFIAISHRRGTMEEADVLYGVTMQNEGISKLLKLDVKEYENVV